jgi:LuxR family quorum sensing-dependent transcriptional regulator
LFAYDAIAAFSEAVEQSETPKAVLTAMEAALAPFGCESLVVVRSAHQDESTAPLVLMQKLPARWFDFYMRQSYGTADPVLRQCRMGSRPFAWAEAQLDPEREPRAAEVMNRAADFGMRHGFSVPVHSPDGFDGCVSMSGGGINLSGPARAVMRLVALQTFEAVQALSKPRETDNPLTGREREALIWACCGKTSSQTSEIMRITERTVIAHIASAVTKLGASNRTHAVAKALSRRWIQL